MLKRLVFISSLLGCVELGCGLRTEPLLFDGGGAGTGASAGTSGHGGAGAGGMGAVGGRGGTGALGVAGTGQLGGRGGAGTGGGGTGGLTVDAGTDAPVCAAGTVCQPTNPCHVGQTACSAAGALSCTDTEKNQANGTVCGSGMVCNDGACAACEAGTACSPTGKPCRTGVIACTTGAPVCTESDDRPNGTSCGTGMVCQTGQCVSCQQGATCTPTNKCHQGTLDCSTGTPQCTDKGTLVAAGTTCGTDMVCSATGVCGACKVGATCSVTGKPCRTGTTTCNTGTATCVESANVANGTSCGTNLVCSSGACVSCTAGLACTPTNPCHAGITSCSPTITCADTGNNLVDGTVCGTNKVCSRGICGICTAGASCQPANPCRTGATSCVTGISACAETGNRPNGTSCGMNQVCNNGTCVPCTAGGSCTPSNPCHTGTLTCMTGSSSCADTGTAVADGKSCGTDHVCKSGSCVPCVAGVACTPSNPCKFGTTSCSTGASVCTASGNKPVGTLCGSAQSCTAGVKTSAAMCDATAVCKTTTTTCPSACNAAGTDCSACLAGETMCSNGCQKLSNDPANCGSCGHVCADPPVVGSGSAICSSSVCGISCNDGYLQCGGTSYCQVQQWGFEDGAPDGFSIVGDQGAVTSISASTSVTHSGNYALAIGIAAQGTARSFQVGLRLCGGSGFVPSKGQTVSAWFYLSPSSDAAPPPHPGSVFGEHLYTSTADGGNAPVSTTVGSWFQVSTPIESVGTQLLQLAVEGTFDGSGGGASDWTGVVYVDDIVIQ